MAIVDIRNRVELQMKEKSGLFYIYMKVDFTKCNISTANDYRIARIADGWLFLGSFFRMPTDSTSAGTIDIGTTQSGTDLDSAIDVDAGSQTSWTTMTPTYAAPVEVASDGYMWLEANAAAVNNGVLEMMMVVMAAPNEDSSVG